MATVAGSKGRARPVSLAPDLAERVVAALSLAMLAAMLTALAFGQAAWGRIPLLVWLHLATIGTALALTPVLLLRRRGTRSHRRIGWAWCIAMAGTAALSLFIDGLSNMKFSWIHILSALTLFGVYGVVRSARAHEVSRHRSTIRAITIGALLVAGVFTLLPSRTLGGFLFG